MVRMVGALAAVAALLGLPPEAAASADSEGGTPPRLCLQVTAVPEAPRRPSGREVRVVTYTVVRTLGVADAVAYPAFFAYPHERVVLGCETLARGALRRAPPRSHGDARGR